MIKALAFSVVLALAGSACTGSEDDDLVLEEGGGKEDVARPYGAWGRELPDSQYGYTKLTLNDDLTYAITKQNTFCESPPCETETTGKFRWATYSTKRYVVLYASDGDWFESFQYNVFGDELNLRETGQSSWIKMTPAAGGALELTEADNGGTFQVVEGNEVVLKLPSRPSSGYNWDVIAVDKSFGYPEESYEDDGTIGALGVQTFTWKTKGPLPLVGDHAVTLGYRRSWETNVPPLETFTFTVKILADNP